MTCGCSLPTSFCGTQTCKIRHKMAQRRFIWSCLAETLCEELGLLKASFPFGEMSTEDLEHLALSPVQFEKFLSLHNGSYQQASHLRVFVPQPSLSCDPLNIHGLTICPGGRFLLTYTFTQGIHLWDLGYSARVVPKREPLTHLPLPSGFHCWPTCPTQNREGIRLTCDFLYVVLCRVATRS